MEYQKVSSATFSKKLKNSYSFTGKSIYDGVFGGTAKVASRVVDDYGEIFGGSGGSSIPILDVPELNKRKVSVDVNSAKLDYSKIFGGFGEFDFAISHEELSAKPKKTDSYIQEARTPAQTGSDTSNFSVKNQMFSPEASYQSLDGVNQFKMSYHKTNQGGKNGTTHVAQLHTIPGSTCLIDKVACSQMTEAEKPFSSVSNDSYHDINFSGGIMEGIPSRKPVSTHPPGGDKKQASRDGVIYKTKSNQSRSNSNDISFDAYEIGIRTNPLEVPPPSTWSHSSGNNKGDSEISRASKCGVSRSHSSEEASGNCSPPYFDEEVDANSVAATSAAAVKKAIEEAQARIRIAKEIMERKKEGLQNHVKLRFKDGSKVEERRKSKIADKVNKLREDVCEKYGKVDIPMPVARLGMQNAVKAGQVAPDFRESDSLFLDKGASGGMHGNANKTAPLDHGQEEMKEWKAEKQGDISAKLVESVNECELKKESFTMKELEKPGENGEKLQVVEEAYKQEEIERKLNMVEKASDLKECADEAKSGQEDYEKKLRVGGILEGIEVMFTASHEIEASEKKLWRFQEPLASEKKLEMQELKDDECMEMMKLKDEQEWLENEQKQKEIFKQEENDTISEDALQREENEVGIQEIFNHKENGERDKAAWERVELEKQQKEVCKTEENELGQEDVHSREEVEKTSNKTVQGIFNGKVSENKLDENVESGVKEKCVEAEENVKMLEEVYKMIEIEKRQKESSAWMQAEKTQAGIRAEGENRITQEALQHCKSNLEAGYDVCKHDKIEILSKTLEASGHGDNNVCLEIPINEENGEVMEVTRASSECKEMETESNAVEVANELEEKDVLEEKEVSEVEIAGLAQVILELNEMKKQVKDTSEALSFDYNTMNLRNDMDIPQKLNESHGKESGTVCDANNHVEELACEAEEIFEDAEEFEVAMKQEEDKSNFELSHEERWFDTGKTIEATQLPSMFQGNGETTEVSHKIKRSPHTERNEENYSKTPKTEERKAEDSLQKEMELEKEHVRENNKIKEKEEEREKERIAVERAIREARERAFTEARERAEKAAVEKANAEARRRAMAEARKRLEKTSTETNDMSLSEKTSIEARLKAERAAVQRATAEARERALEKAISEKAALEARNQAVKSSGASRDTGTRQNFAFNDSHYRSSRPTSSLENPNSSNNGVPCSTDIFVGVNGESAQRDKASLERHKRTAERAAKALAEKNMRDRLAQKEQAERNRLAEALDADVKRWSSGKAGNLRALLSTLQYILGPDSGWQPIPLTDLVKNTAVKKAYRKATLFVHPDKLQQRGASIQQKYTCEKVFDLLKEAWNKFSAEER